MEDQQNPNVVVAVQTKSMGLSLILTFFFGPLGMLYSTILGGIIMFFVEVFVGLFTFGFGLLLTHPICMIWGAVATNTYNEKLLKRYQ
ncbi:hypothetical protein SAMN05444487_11720 [Marininema mesophilum]|uniref:Uncharacterized protein n=1 Tax=Marininema mesophilum TaxID=1048340 RepID=A0A1H3BJ02_9BACL|nr:hypothetical protein [Marininema mesophilum]SDX41923.1 hypothetical protein SAMN05444487_11720 [Marininema mesophilum]